MSGITLLMLRFLAGLLSSSSEIAAIGYGPFTDKSSGALIREKALAEGWISCQD